MRLVIDRRFRFWCIPLNKLMVNEAFFECSWCYLTVVGNFELAWKKYAYYWTLPAWGYITSDESPLVRCITSWWNSLITPKNVLLQSSFSEEVFDETTLLVTQPCIRWLFTWIVTSSRGSQIMPIYICMPIMLSALKWTLFLKAMTYGKIMPSESRWAVSCYD